MMQVIYETQAPKRATNLSVNSDLLNKARALNINLSATLEESLITLIKAKQQQAWLAQNQQAIDGYNQQADEHGAFADKLRVF
ncbi:MAG: type II toxin-antitoxin system CcdA family antitoxin [Methylotenera sp.]